MMSASRPLPVNADNQKHRCNIINKNKMKTTYKRYIAIAVAAAALTGIAVVPAFAQTNYNNGPENGQGNSPAWQGHGQGMMHGVGGTAMPPGVFGSVTAINGTTITVASRSFGQNTATTTYTVDASNATVYKNNATSTLSIVAVGDRVFVQGTISGTSVTATTVRDGIAMMRGAGKGGPSRHGPGTASSTPPFKGNGEPVVAGTVASVSGTSISITTSSNTSYTVDASSATVSKGGSTSTVSAISVGDYLVVQGAINGTSVTAATVIDQPATAANPSGNKPSVGGHTQGGMGFFGSIGGFFKHLFGF